VTFVVSQENVLNTLESNDVKSDADSDSVKKVSKKSMQKSYQRRKRWKNGVVDFSILLCAKDFGPLTLFGKLLAIFKTFELSKESAIF
jgi:hypothetical protein